MEEPDTCVICAAPHNLSTYNEMFMNCVCAHTYFHPRCITALVVRGGACPTCRSQPRPAENALGRPLAPPPEVQMSVRDMVIFAFMGFYALCMLLLIAAATFTEADTPVVALAAVWSNTPKYLYILTEAVVSIRHLESGFMTHRIPLCASFLVFVFTISAIILTYICTLTDNLQGTMRTVGAIISFEYLVLLAVLGLTLAITIAGILARACRCI